MIFTDNLDWDIFFFLIANTYIFIKEKRMRRRRKKSTNCTSKNFERETFLEKNKHEDRCQKEYISFV
jgi:hypothetical protein